MKEANKTGSRREFIEGALRTVALSGLAFTGLSLGWRGISRSGQDSSCPIDLPCRICSRLPGCRQAKAKETKREYNEYSSRTAAKKGSSE